MPTIVLHLVRHAAPAQDPSGLPWEWTLAQAASTAAELRASGVLPQRALWVSTPEPKARATAALLTDAPVQLDDDLREAVRSADLVEATTFERRVHRSFAHPERSASPGWEPLVVTQARMLRVARAAVADAGGADVVLVGHGTALTMLVAALSGGSPDMPAWQAMRMPDHCSLSWPAAISAAWGQWRGGVESLVRAV